MLSSLYGLFDHVAEVAHGVGLLAEKPEETQGYRALEEHGVPVFGLPFSLTLTERTNKEQRTRFPVVAFSPDGDLVQWMMGVCSQVEALSEGRDALLLPASVADDTPEVIAADVLEVDPEAAAADEGQAPLFEEGGEDDG